MTGVIGEQVRGLAAAGEPARAVGGAVQEVVRAVVAGRAAAGRHPPGPWGGDDRDPWDDTGDRWGDEDGGYDRGGGRAGPAAAPGRPDAEPTAAPAVSAGVHVARSWLAARGGLLAAAGAGLAVALLGLLGGPALRAAVAAWPRPPTCCAPPTRWATGPTGSAASDPAPPPRGRPAAVATTRTRPRPDHTHNRRKDMSATATNGPARRKQLSDQLDRLDGIIDALADALPQAVAEAAREGTRLAVRDAILEILSNPELRHLLAGAAPPADPPAPPADLQPGLWSRAKAVAAAAGAAVAASAAPAAGAVARRCRAAVEAVRSPARSVAVARLLRRVALTVAGAGLTAALVGLLYPHAAAALGALTGAGAAAAAWAWARVREPARG